MTMTPISREQLVETAQAISLHTVYKIMVGALTMILIPVLLWVFMGSYYTMIEIQRSATRTETELALLKQEITAKTAYIIADVDLVKSRLGQFEERLYIKIDGNERKLEGMVPFFAPPSDRKVTPIPVPTTRR